MKIKFDVYDTDSKKADLRNQTLIGTCNVEPYEIVRAPKQRLSRELTNGNEKRGELIVSAETISNKVSAHVIFIEFEGNIFSSSKYFLKLYRQKEINSPEFIPVYQTETKQSNERAMRWKRIRIGATSLIKDDFNSNIKIEIMQFSSNGNHIKVGEATFNFKVFMETKPIIYFLNDTSSFVRPASIIFEERYSFVEYLCNGLNISLILAIDFTASNLNPVAPGSLHNMNLSMNQYLSSISSVGSILECYDTDKMIPVLGFGAKILGFNQNVSHCFALNGNIFAPEVFGIKGVADIYLKNILKLSFFRPTHFHLILNYVANMVDMYVKNGVLNTFFVLMIITDGIIQDFSQAIDEIVRCSYLPLSIIIVGVGNEDFAQMEHLDADKGTLSSKKYGKPKADMVQFIPMRKYLGNPERLVYETLKELPYQVSDYMKSINAHPKNLINCPNPANFKFQEMMKNEFLGSYGNDPNLKRAVSIGIPTLENGFISTYTYPQYVNPFLF